MGILDGPLKDLASLLIGTFSDNPATLVRMADLDYDPTTGETVPSAMASYSVKVTPPERYSLKEIDGTTVLATDVRVYLAAKDIAIEPSPRSDTLTVSNHTYTVYKVTKHYSGDEVCLWELQLRG